MLSRALAQCGTQIWPVSFCFWDCVFGVMGRWVARMVESGSADAWCMQCRRRTRLLMRDAADAQMSA